MRYTATTTCVVLTIIVLMICTNPSAAVNAAEYTHPSVLLEKGIYEEETKGDVAAAITIYQQIVDDAQANRKYIANAHYRMGMCYLKKDQPKQAIEAFDRVIKNFAEQKNLAEQAKQQRSKALATMGVDEVNHIVEQAVMTISNCTESDPKIKTAIDTLDGLDQQAVISALQVYLDDHSPTIRRATIYILWNGNFDEIAPADNNLLALCDHEEDLTRGMAAIALGQNQVAQSYDRLKEMTLEDKSGYARRCAAYALALMGNAEAKDTLTKALNDSDSLVKANAQFALKKLANAGPVQWPPRIMKTVPATLTNDVDPNLDTISVTFNQQMINNSWSWTGGGESYPQTVGRPWYDNTLTTCNVKVDLEPGKVYQIGINSPSHQNFKSTKELPVPWHIILFATRGADGTPTEINPEWIENVTLINAAALRGTPEIISTSPKALSNNISASLDKITVTFNQPMKDGTWSWTGGGETFPKTTGKIHYNDDKTICTLPVKLEPGKVYWIGINSPSHKNFKNDAFIPAKRYVILFATADENGKPTRIPSNMLNRARKINATAKSAK